MPDRSDYEALVWHRQNGGGVPHGFSIVASTGAIEAAHGVFGTVYRNWTTNEHIVVFQGPSSGLPAARANNIDVVNGRVPPSLEVAREFFDTFRLSNDIPKENIFVSGYSAGALQAQYIGKVENIAGRAYGGPGVPDYNPSDLGSEERRELASEAPIRT
jgi:hypothetical protein